MLRVFLFLAVNIAILITISISWSLVSLFFDIPQTYFNYIAFFSLAFGMGGAFFSLMISKFMAKKAFGVRIISQDTRNPEEKKLLNQVHLLAKRAGLSKMPEVGIYESEQMNAFATGPSRRNSLVAFSTGILKGMDEEALEGVIGHEIAHIANGDMVTMTLIQGVLNALVLFVSRVIARTLAEKTDKGVLFEIATIILLDVLLSALAALVVSAFSRRREFRADLGSAKLVGKHKMIQALKALAHGFSPTRVEEGGMQRAFYNLQISHRSRIEKSRFLRLFSSHPPLETRILALEKMRIH